MSTGMKIGLGFMFAFIMGTFGLVVMVISSKFTANEFETAIHYSYKDQQNIYSNMNKNMEAAGLTVENYGETAINAIKEKAKQYADKPELVAQFVSEKPQNIDSAIWMKFMDSYKQDSIAIQNAQTARLSKAEAYQTWLGSSAKGFIAGTVFNYPTPSIKEEMEKVVITSKTTKAFETGVDEDAKVFGGSK
jgi:hypothetical protein